MGRKFMVDIRYKTTFKAAYIQINANLFCFDLNLTIKIAKIVKNGKK